jgi:hypothetical protein
MDERPKEKQMITITYVVLPKTEGESFTWSEAEALMNTDGFLCRSQRLEDEQCNLFKLLSMRDQNGFIHLPYAASVGSPSLFSTIEKLLGKNKGKRKLYLYASLSPQHKVNK